MCLMVLADQVVRCTLLPSPLILSCLLLTESSGALQPHWCIMSKYCNTWFLIRYTYPNKPYCDILQKQYLDPALIYYIHYMCKKILVLLNLCWIGLMERAFFLELKPSLTWTISGYGFFNLTKTFAQTNKCTLDFTLHKSKRRKRWEQ